MWSCCFSLGLSWSLGGTFVDLLIWNRNLRRNNYAKILCSLLLQKMLSQNYERKIWNAWILVGRANQNRFWRCFEDRFRSLKFAKFIMQASSISTLPSAAKDAVPLILVTKERNVHQPSRSLTARPDVSDLTVKRIIMPFFSSQPNSAEVHKMVSWVFQIVFWRSLDISIFKRAPTFKIICWNVW